MIIFVRELSLPAWGLARRSPLHAERGCPILAFFVQPHDILWQSLGVEEQELQFVVVRDKL